uniref:Uncharacterized protein n=1 Tax=Anguilla anguilla TaxID=7936 RepID=A0A0E9X8W5_ANGAN
MEIPQLDWVYQKPKPSLHLRYTTPSTNKQRKASGTGYLLYVKSKPTLLLTVLTITSLWVRSCLSLVRLVSTAVSQILRLTLFLCTCCTIFAVNQSEQPI